MLATKLHFIYHGITPLTVVAILNHSVIHQRRGPYYLISCHAATLINPAMVSLKIMQFKSRELKFLISVACICLNSTKKILKLTNTMDNLVIPSACLIYSMFQTKKGDFEGWRVYNFSFIGKIPGIGQIVVLRYRNDLVKK